MGNSVAAGDYSVVLSESFSQLRLISGFGNKDITMQKIDSAYSDVAKTSYMLQILQLIVQSAYGPIGMVAVLVTFLIGNSLGIESVQIIVMIYAFYRLAQCASEFAGHKTILLSTYPAYERVTKIANQADSQKLEYGTLDEIINIALLL